ncbi:hypothetical protein [Acinetobacter radioresistens]|uniref:RipA family octameric membrane protein n=1 Tax=Acinetobacter radioresistens TaxID=40216 RepID=UPI003212357F
MSNEVNSKLKALQRVYEISVNTRNFEITQLTNRNNYYMLFQGVLLAAVFSNQASKPLVEFIICSAGIGVSYNQVKVASGAKFWQEYWEFQASEAEKALKTYTQKYYDYEFTDLFNLDSENMKNKVIQRFTDKLDSQNLLDQFYTKLILKRASVSRAPIYTAAVLFVCWSALLLHTVKFVLVFDLLHSFIVGHFFNVLD